VAAYFYYPSLHQQHKLLVLRLFIPFSICLNGNVEAKKAEVQGGGNLVGASLLTLFGEGFNHKTWEDVSDRNLTACARDSVM